MTIGKDVPIAYLLAGPLSDCFHYLASRTWAYDDALLLVAFGEAALDKYPQHSSRQHLHFSGNGVARRGCWHLPSPANCID